jgi:hypothetical protein
MSLSGEQQLALFGDPTPSTSGHAADLPPVPEDAEPARPIPETAERVPRQLSMLASYADPSIPTLVEEPEDEQGWQEEYGRSLPKVVGGVCEAMHLDPCPHVTCRLHLLIHVDESNGGMVLNEGANGRLGRPPLVLPATDDADAADFMRKALDQLPKLRWECVLKFRAYFKALGRDPTEEEVGEALGVSDETARLDFLRAAMQWKELAAEGGYRNTTHADMGDAVEAMRRAQLAREAPRHPPLVQIRKRPR